MPAPRRRSHLSALALIVVGALALAACGGDDDDPATTSPTTSAAETTSTASTGTTSTTESTPTTSEDPPDVDALRDQFNEQLRQVLTDEQGLTADQADCAIDELQDSLTDDALRQVAETGKPPEGVIDAAFDAGAKCKDD